MNHVPPLFDVNAWYGKSATQASAPFATLAARLAHMDRLGVQRAVVWNIESRQHHALSSNEHLLAEWASTPAAADRIVPALAVSPLMLYEVDGVAKLRDQLRRGGTRALRFTRVFGRITLEEVQPVIEAIRDLRPFIVMSHNEADPQDILRFTAALPEIPVVLTEAMWPAAISMGHLLRRRPNLLLDNSWLHTARGAELNIKHFGPDRLVFGLGPAAHNGAAIAALARADLTGDQRARIAHGTLDRLCGLASTVGGQPERAGGELWRRCLAGQALGVDIVDAHGHIGPSGGFVLADQDEVDQIPRSLVEMDRLGIRTMVTSGLAALMGDPVAGNELMERLLSRQPARHLGYVVFNPNYADALMPRLDEWFSRPFFVGFKVLCGYWQVAAEDPRFAPMWAYAHRHRLPILAHTWDHSLDAPSRFADWVRQYPEACLLLGHSGGGDSGRAEAVALARQAPNVLLEWCGSFCSSVPWEETLAKVGPERVVYGSDAMVHDMFWEIGRLLSLQVSDDALRAILAGNMRRVLAARR